MTVGLSINVVNVVTPGGAKDYVVLTNPDDAFSLGLIPEAILGVLEKPLASSGAITPDNFIANSVFRRFLSDVIARHGPDDPDLQAEAKRIGKGGVVIVDRRTRTPEGPVPPEDIAGIFTIEEGKVVPDSYRPSNKHKLLTADGFFRLNRFLEDCLARDLGALTASQRKPD